MLSWYGFGFEEYGGVYWDYISTNPSVTGVDGRDLPLYYTGNGLVHIIKSFSYSAGNYGYLASSTADQADKQVYFALAPYKITAGVDSDRYFGISLCKRAPYLCDKLVAKRKIGSA